MRVFAVLEAGSVFGNTVAVTLIRNENGFVYYSIEPPVPFLSGSKSRSEVAAWCPFDIAIDRLRRAGMSVSQAARVDAALAAITSSYNSAGLGRPGIITARQMFMQGLSNDEVWLEELRAEAEDRRGRGATKETDLYIDAMEQIDRIREARSVGDVGSPRIRGGTAG